MYNGVPVGLIINTYVNYDNGAYFSGVTYTRTLFHVLPGPSITATPLELLLALTNFTLLRDLHGTV